MMKIFKILFFILISLNIQAMDSRRAQIISVIDEELSELTRLYKTKNDTDAKLLLRMAELYLEKARLLKEDENSRYMSLSDEARRNVNRVSFFNESTKNFKAADKVCIQILNRHKRFNAINDVYYILAYNAKEFNDNQKAKKYFKLANNKSPNNNQTKIKSQISLAEIYYNEKKYNQSIPLYEKALSQHRDQWWTKDLFNLAWSYFRVHKYDKAIQTMLTIYQSSADKKFLDMRENVVRDIGLFYAVAGKIDEGVEFYKKVDVNFKKLLIQIGLRLKAESRFTEATKVFYYAEKYNNDEKELFDIYIESLDLFDKFGKEDQHLATSRKLYNLLAKIKLNNDELERVQYQFARKASILQKKVVDRANARLPAKRKKYGEMAIVYFSMLEKIQSNKKSEILFLIGETNFAIPKYDEALASYRKTFEYAKSTGDSKYMGRSLDAMLATIGQVDFKNRSKYYVEVYELFIVESTNNATSENIHQKLFKIYIDSNNIQNAERILLSYKKKYPQSFKIQEAMVANIMEYHNKRKDEASIKSWVSRIDSGEFKVSTQYRNKLTELLTSMQMASAQENLKNGKKKEALTAYLKLLERSDLTPRARANSYYNLSVLYYELRHGDNAYKYALKSLETMTHEQRIQFADTFFAIGAMLFEQGYFERSADINIRVMQFTCRDSKSDRNLKSLKNAFVILKANGDTKTIGKLLDVAKDCKVADSEILKLNLELMDLYKVKSEWAQLESMLSIIPMSYIGKKIVYQKLLIEKYSQTKQPDKANHLQRQFLNDLLVAKKNLKRLDYEALDIIAGFENIELAKNVDLIFQKKLSFPENVFNPMLKGKLEQLDKIVSKAINIQKIGSGRGIVTSHVIVARAYSGLINEIKDFEPENKSPEYKQSFKKAMMDVWKPLAQSLEKLNNDFEKTVSNNEILSDDYVQNSKKINKYRYHNNTQGIISERWGRL